MKKKIYWILGVVTVVLMLALIPLPAKSYGPIAWDETLAANMHVPAMHVGGVNTDCWTYRHQNEIWGVSDGQGHYLKITWDWEATVKKGYLMYYRRDFVLRLADGSTYRWYDEYMPSDPATRNPGGFNPAPYVYDYTAMPAQKRPVEFGVISTVVFVTLKI